MRPKFTKYFPWVALLCLIALTVWAANPSFSSFNGTQFNTTASQVSIGNGALITNTVAWQSGGLNYGLIVQGSSGLRINDAAGNQQGLLDGVGNATLNGLTASTVLWANGSKTIASIPNGVAGALTNNGSGVLGWFALGAGGSTVTSNSVTIPMGAWSSANAILPATSASPSVATNFSDVFVFASGVTNSIHALFNPGLRWDAGTVEVGLRGLTMGTNWTSRTNVVWAVRCAALNDADLVNNPTWSTVTRVTNALNTNIWYGKFAYTARITVGGSPTANSSILWEISRQGADAGDSVTNTLGLSEVRVFYNETGSNPSYPAPSP